MREMSDEELILAVASRDELALLELSRRYVPYFRAMIRRMMDNADEQEELVQEIMVRVWETAPLFDLSKATATTWLVTAAHRLAVNRLRQRPEIIDPELRRRAVAQPDQVEILDQLGVDSGRLLELAFFGGYTHEELAAQTGRPPGMVGADLERAVVRLRGVLDVPDEG